MLDEPAPTLVDINFRLFGIPVRIHPFFWLVAVILGVVKLGALEMMLFGSGNLGVLEIIIWITAVLISILVHELGHAMVIKAYGYHPKIVLYDLGGITSYYPTDDSNSKSNTLLKRISIYFAGPMAGFILAVVFAALLFLIGQPVFIDWFYYFIPMFFWSDSVQLAWMESIKLASFVNDIFFISTFWGIINLLPIYPLDGGQIARELFLYLNPQKGIRRSLIISRITAWAIAIFHLVPFILWVLVGQVWVYGILNFLFIATFFIYLANVSSKALQACKISGNC